jgi:hypothetical protein
MNNSRKGSAEVNKQVGRNPSRYTVVKAGGIFILPRIFPSYLMKILQQIFRKNVLVILVDTFPKVARIFPSSHIP